MGCHEQIIGARERDLRVPQLRQSLARVNQPLLLRKVQWPEQDGVHDRENRSVRANAQPQSGYTQECKPGRPPQRTERISKILQHVFYPSRAPSVAALLFEPYKSIQGAYG